MKTALIKIKGVKKDFYENFFKRSAIKKNVISGISFEIYPQEIITLTGANGVGKTTLLKILNNTLVQDEGEIIYNSLDKNDILYISSSDRSFFWRLSVKDNLQFFIDLYNIKNTDPMLSIMRALEYFNISHKINASYMSLSSGEKKRLSFAKAFLLNPKIYLFDEPFNAIDLITQEIFLNFINLVKERNNSSVIIVDHNIRLLNKLSDRSILLKDGKIREVC